MPAFVHDEARWEKAKEAAGKQASKGSDSYWKLSNYIYHKMGKSQEDVTKAEEFKKSLMMPKAPKAPSLGMPSASKMPKAKMMPKATDKPSVFFKKEEFDNIKRSSIENLRDFLEQHRSKRQS